MIINPKPELIKSVTQDLKNLNSDLNISKLPSLINWYLTTLEKDDLNPFLCTFDRAEWIHDYDVLIFNTDEYYSDFEKCLVVKSKYFTNESKIIELPISLENNTLYAKNHKWQDSNNLFFYHHPYVTIIESDLIVNDLNIIVGKVVKFLNKQSYVLLQSNPAYEIKLNGSGL